MSDKPIDETDTTAEDYVDPYGEDKVPDPMPSDLQLDEDQDEEPMEGDAPTG